MQGLCQLEDIEDYELADQGDHFAADGQWDDDAADMDYGGGHYSECDDHGSEPVLPVVVTDEQRERIERNKRAAMERAAVRQVASTGVSSSGEQRVTVTARAAQPVMEEEEDFEAAWAAAEGGDEGGFDAFDEEAAAEAGFDAFDEEAETAFYGNFGASYTQGGENAAAHEPPSVVADDVPDELAAQEAAEQARAEAQAAAEALEAGFDDEF